MKGDKKDKLIKMLLLIINQNRNKFDPFKYIDYHNEKPQKLGLKDYDVLIEEEINKLSRGEIETPLDHIEEFIQDNKDKHNTKYFMKSLYDQMKENGIFENEEKLNDFFKNYKDLLSQKLSNKIDPPVKTRGVGRPRKSERFVEGDITQPKIKQGRGRPKRSKNKK